MEHVAIKEITPSTDIPLRGHFQMILRILLAGIWDESTRALANGVSEELFDKTIIPINITRPDQDT